MKKIAVILLAAALCHVSATAQQQPQKPAPQAAVPTGDAALQWPRPGEHAPEPQLPESQLQLHELPELMPAEGDLYMEFMLSRPLPTKIDWTRNYKFGTPQWHQRNDALVRMKKLADESILTLPKAVGASNVTAQTGIFNVNVGNGRNNFSVFMDARLDARTIRFPLPRNIRPDNRPLHVQRLDKMQKVTK